MSLQKVSLSLPTTLVDDLAYLSSRMNVSKSALLSNLASAPVSDMRAMTEAVPDNPTPEDLVRARGVSTEIVKKRIAALQQLGEEDGILGD